jgi:hypothetical protein
VNIALERLFEGIVATLRADVIPNVSDGYARGQAVGVIDLINNIAARVEWARAPLLESVCEKRRLLSSVAAALEEPSPEAGGAMESLGSAELSAERARLEADICEAMKRAHARSGEPAAREALRLMIRHAHDEAAAEMKLTRKPLFGEIASGKDRKPVPAERVKAAKNAEEGDDGAAY